ncbi:MAG: DUF4338 domain-containing protein, partial [Albidovulum sp.]|nr:DUF4338 domain-containing protein [Albidovulum sp.]
MELRIMDAVDLSELRVEPITREMEPRFNELMDRHHYLGAGPRIGESIWYAGDFGDGDWVARPAFSAAALKCAARDDWIGWGLRFQYGGLHPIANNVRMPPLGRRGNLGSRLPSL